MVSRLVVRSGLVLAAIAVVGLGGTYWKYPDIFQPPTVTTAVASLAPVSAAVYGTGTVEPERWAKVVPLQRRRVVELCRCEGQGVKAGQVLGRQDDAEERNALKQTRNQQRATRARRGSRPQGPRQERCDKDRIRAAVDPVRGIQIADQRAKGPSQLPAYCARRWTAWCCVATARSARSSDRPMCCSG